MSSPIAALRSHRAVVAALIVAAIAVTACALVAIAVMLDWLPAKTSVPTPTSMAAPGQQVAGSAPGVELLPGETLVAPSGYPQSAAEAPLPSDTRPPAPMSAKPVPVTPSYTPLARRKPSAAPSREAAAPSRKSVTPPARYAQSPPPERAIASGARAGICINCAVVSSIGTHAEDWEVRVRFEDGTSKTLRYPTQPAFRPGQRVYLEDGRLVPE